jgi:transposase
VRGGNNQTGELFSYVDLEARVRRAHPLRMIRAIVNEALSALEREFAALYSPIRRPSIPPEKLLRAMLLQAFYSIRSERLLMERLSPSALYPFTYTEVQVSLLQRTMEYDYVPVLALCC